MMSRVGEGRPTIQPLQMSWRQLSVEIKETEKPKQEMMQHVKGLCFLFLVPYKPQN